MNISQKSAAINKIDRGLFLLLHVAALHSPQAGSLSAACLPRVKQVFRAWQTSKGVRRSPPALRCSGRAILALCRYAASPIGKAAPPACSAQSAPRSFYSAPPCRSKGKPPARFARPCPVGCWRALRAPHAPGAPQPAPLLRRGSLAPLPHRGRKALFSLRSKSFPQHIRAPCGGNSARGGARLSFNIYFHKCQNFEIIEIIYHPPAPPARRGARVRFMNDGQAVVLSFHQPLHKSLLLQSLNGSSVFATALNYKHVCIDSLPISFEQNGKKL